MGNKFLKFLGRLFNREDGRVDSKIVSVFVSLLLLVVTTFFVLFGIPPIEAEYTTDLIWGLVSIILGGSGIEVANQFARKKVVKETEPEQPIPSDLP